MSERLSVAEVYASLGQSLRGFIRSRVSDRHAADDLLQETFLRIQKQLHTLEDSERLGAWVFQIARNLINDHYRSLSRSAETSAAVEPLMSGEVERANLNKEVVEWLPRFVDGLPETYRRAVRLYELEGLSQKAVAAELGLSLSGAKSRIQRGREALRKALLACCSFEIDRLGNVVDYASQQSDLGKRAVVGDRCGC